MSQSWAFSVVSDDSTENEELQAMWIVSSIIITYTYVHAYYALYQYCRRQPVCFSFRGNVGNDEICFAAFIWI